VGTVLFFLFCFGFLWWQVNPALQFQFQMPLFFIGKPFLTEFLNKPGGWLEYGTRFLAQFSQCSWAGALIATAILFVTYLATRWLLGTELIMGQSGHGSERRTVMDLIPVGLLFLLASRYDYPWLETSAGLVAALGAAVGYFALPLRTPWLRLSVFYLLFGLLVYAAGIIPAALFVSLGGLLELVATRRWVWGSVCLVSGWLLTAWVGQYFAIRPAELAVRWGEGYSRMLTLALYLFYPLGILFRVAFRGRASAVPAPQTKGKSTGKRPRSFFERLRAWKPSGWLHQGIRWSLLLVTAVAALDIVDDNRKALIQVDYYSSRGQWDEVLKVVPRLETLNGSSRLNINRALYHRGRLLDSLFSYLQTREFGLLPGPEQGLEICRALSATLLELGQVNLAEHWAHEALEKEGDRPDLLQLLVKINLVKDRTQAARIFLGRLRQSPFHRRWADDYLQRLARDPTVADDAEIAGLRAVKVTTDYASGFEFPDTLLLQLLHTNPKNRMAFEYLMAHYLLDLKPEAIVKQLDRLDDFQLSQLPRHLAEALIAHQRHVYLQTQQTINLRERTFPPETRQRFDRFLEVFTSFKGNAKAAYPALARDFGDTYWHYNIYQETVLKRPPSKEVTP
jgi:hypothetical protein